MPISTENAHVTLEFVYSSTDSDIMYYVKYHRVDDKMIISVSEDSKDWYRFPEEFFTEVVEFISSQNISSTLNKSTNSTNSTSVKKKIPGQSKSSKSALSLPVIEEIDTEQPEKLEIDNNIPLEALSGLSAKVSKSRKTKVKIPNEEVINRPVFRGVNQEEASEMRGLSEQSIKSKHR